MFKMKAGITTRIDRGAALARAKSQLDALIADALAGFVDRRQLADAIETRVNGLRVSDAVLRPAL